MAELLARTQALLEVMLTAMEATLASCDEQSQAAVLFGPRGLVMQMPKLVQLASQLAELQLQLNPPMQVAEQESYPPISEEDLRLLKQWLER